MILDQDLIDDARAIERRLIDGQAEPKTLAHDCLVMIQRLRKALDSRDDYLQSIEKPDLWPLGLCGVSCSAAV